ncbi:MAG: PD-(D/E)XK nuclease family protein [Candidatus Hydrogenedentota bacterium]|uniref:ATP-dependent nuclease, subunit B n=1 Tax=Sumerlaea chitinivorans TaxID=2250252 RepID=A0A2Z4Y431_SUMC1|nr:ATP-dependent nuclease, subunit B [Candidatus Sumerlaea chitinivorans]RMH25436.1 MAG: PD-(D/E)XK nuclease family protein [Candidatus Hydrogenedentota bacterium]
MIQLYDRRSSFQRRMLYEQELANLPSHASPLIVVKTKSIARTVARKIARSYGRGLTQFVLSLKEFEDRLLEGAEEKPIDPPQLAIWIRELFKHQPDMFSALNQVSGAPFPLLAHGMLRRLSQEIMELLSGDDSVSHDNSSDLIPLKNLAELVREQLAKTGIELRPALLKRRAEKLTNEELLGVVSPASRIVFDFFDSFDPWLWRLFERVSTLPISFEVLLDFDPAEEASKFPHLARIWDDLLRLSHSQGAPSGRVSLEPIIEPQPIIECYCANSREEEVRAIAEYLRAELDRHSEGVFPFEEYMVCFPNLAEYAPLVRSVFREVGVPYHLARWREFQGSAMWHTLQLLAEIAGDPMSKGETQEAIEALLRLRIVLGEFWTTSPVGLFRRCANFVGRWDDLNGFCERLSKQLAAAGRQASENEDEEDDGGTGPSGFFKDETNRHRVSELLEALNDLNNWLAELRKERTFEEWEHLLTGRFLPIAAAAPKNLGGYAPSGSHIWQGLSVESFWYFRESVRQFLRLLSRLRSVYTQVTDKMGLHTDDGNSARLRFPELIELVDFIGREERVADRTQYVGGFPVVGAFEVVANAPRVLIVGGLVETEFPSSPTNVLSVWSRAVLAQRCEEHLSSQRYLFSKFLKNPRDRVILFWPRFREHDEEFVPSQFLADYDLIASARSVEELKKELRARSVGVRESALSADLRGENLLKKVVRNVAVASVAEQTRQGSVESIFHSRILDRELVERLANAARTHRFSPSSLTWLSKCPRQFFFRRVLRVERTVLEEDVRQSYFIGNVVHRALANFVMNWDWDVDPTIQDEQKAMELLETSLRQIAQEESLSDFDIALLRLELLGEDAWAEESRNLGYLGAFLKAEQQLRAERNARIESVCVEQPFPGPASDQKHALPELSGELSLNDTPGCLVDRILVSGRIDRVDKVHTDKATYWLVVDYKTSSRVPPTADMRNGLELQIPVYVLVLMQSGWPCDGGYFYKLARDRGDTFETYFIPKSVLEGLGRNRQKTHGVEDKEFEDGLSSTKRRLAEIVGWLYQGLFYPDSTADKACKNCAYRYKICRLTRQELARIKLSGASGE